ncbi:MAG: ATP-binding cassette domain-containing protein [Burkholderiaceae bacterium]
MTAVPGLSVDALSFAYPGRLLFDGWSHVFAPGVTWVRGDNGCGKSTLLRLLGGALEPRAGTIRCGDVDARAQPNEYRRRVFWCDPDGPAFDHLKPAEFFGFIAGRYPGFDGRLSDALVRSLGLEPFLPRRIRELSTGSRKKVGVIAAIASGCTVILLDEPLAALDRASSHVVRDHLARAASIRDRTWIVASHEPLVDGGDEVALLERRSRD